MRRALLLIAAVVPTAIACTPDPGPPPVLALAYTDGDGVAGYQAGGTDVVIAMLTDTNRDGRASAGDMVTTNQYPLDFDATAFGTFGTTSHEVASVRTSSATSVGARDASGAEFYFEHFDGAPEQERYGELDPAGQFTVYIAEEGSSGRDWLQAGPDAPSAPDTAVGPVIRNSTTDDPFIQVEIRS